MITFMYFSIGFLCLSLSIRIWSSYQINHNYYNKVEQPTEH